MKKRIVDIVLCLVMLVMVAGTVVLICTEHEAIASLIAGGGVNSQVITACIMLVLLVLVFAFLTVVLITRLKKDIVGKKDPLTGLNDKKHVRARFENATEDIDKYSCLAYVAFDSGRVKARYGQETVDKLQKGAADIIKASFDDDDCAARIDEGVFTLFIGCRDGLHAQQKINELTAKLNKYQHQLLYENLAPFRSGIYIPERTEATFDTALENAKLGYRYAGDNNVSTFICTQDIVAQEESRMRLRTKLSDAIDNNEFETYLQLVLDVKKNKFVGAEVLSRWNNPEEGLMMPAYYINDMHNTGMIEKFDMYMLKKTCTLLESWKGTDFEGFILSCNITRVTISSPDFTDNFKRILREHSFDHTRLVIEITEDAFVDNQTLAYKNVAECKNEGFNVAIDDFGVGNSSISDINDYPVDQIKVDREITAKVTTKRGDELLRGLVQLAHRLNIEVVCEGVENKRQNDHVVKGGCDYIQGYYYSYVFPIEEAQQRYLDSLAGIQPQA